MQKVSHTFPAVCFLIGIVSIVGHLSQNSWEFTGNMFFLASIWAFCVHVHFRVAHIEKRSQ